MYDGALIKSKARVKQHGEVFTPEHIVKQMCDLCEPDISQIDKKVFEPTCGNGNFLVEILRRKLTALKPSIKSKRTPKDYEISAFEFSILTALSNIYAVDIQEDNVIEARKRMRGVIFDYVADTKNTATFLTAVDTILKANIICGNTLTMKKSLLFFDFEPQPQTQSFIVTKYSMKDIEEIAERTEPSNISELASTIMDLKSPPKKHIPKKHKPKPVAEKPIAQTLLFEEKTWANEKI